MVGKSPKSVSPGDRLLIIRFSAMGDVAMLAPVLRILQATYPQTKVIVLTRSFFAPIFRDIPRLTVQAADLKGEHKGISGLRRLFNELKEIEISAVGDMHNVLRSKVLKIFFMFTRIPVISINKGRAEKKALTSTNNKIFRRLKSTHQRYADVLAGLGYPIDLTGIEFPEKYSLSAEIIEVTGSKDSVWIGIAPFAAHKAKAYPLNLCKEVLDALSKERGMKIFLLGGGADETQALDILASGYENVIALAGKFKFEKELDVISNLDLMVSMDSGNAHLAAMFGIKVLTIWGVTHPYTGFAAFNQPEDHHLIPDRNKFPAIPTSVYGNKFPEGYEHVIESISPNEIVKKIKEMIN